MNPSQDLCHRTHLDDKSIGTVAQRAPTKKGRHVKVYISVDIEGIAGISHWDEALDDGQFYPEFRKLMTDEALAAVEGARAAGASQITLRDAHESGRNIEIGRISDDVTLIRGWSGHPYKMLQELDDSYDAVVMVGWHGPATDSGNPLSHTMTGRYAQITLNGALMSEYLIHAHLAATLGVPVVFLAGDQSICQQARQVNPAMQVVETKHGIGASITSLTPQAACRQISQGVAKALGSDLATHTLPQAKSYTLEIRFSYHQLAYPRSFYPGAKLIAADTLRFDHADIFEIARALSFM